jgi:hypothetical protein
VLLTCAVVLAGAAAVAAGRAGAVAADRARADTVAEVVVSVVARSRVGGAPTTAACRRGVDLARADGARVDRCEERGARIEVLVTLGGSRGRAAAALEW